MQHYGGSRRAWVQETRLVVEGMQYQILDRNSLEDLHCSLAVVFLLTLPLEAGKTMRGVTDDEDVLLADEG